MIKMVKNNAVMAVRDNNQAAAFLNAGWTKAGETESVATKPNVAPVENTTTETAYTRTTISRLNVAELKELATKEGLDDVEKKSGSELKRELIEHFDL